MKLMKRNTPTFLPSLLDEFFGRDMFDAPVRNNLPAVNVKETENEFLLELAAPGMDKNNFNLELTEDVLTISYENKTENTKEDEGYTRKEFSYSSFKRSFVIPEGVDVEKIKAKYNDGILNLHLPKREEAKIKEPKRIKIS